MSGKVSQELLVEIDQLNTKLKKNPKNLTYLCRLASLHLDDNKISRSRPHMHTAIQTFKETKGTNLKQTIDLFEAMIKFWKAEKAVPGRQDMKLNISAEREQFLQQTHEIAKTAIAKQDSEFAHLLSLKMAYVKECKGDFQGALALLSDLIAAQAMDNVDLSYIIFKAAIILMHVGQAKQSIEYLEFIMDDPPVQDGFTKAHLCAFLVHVYEQSGEKYKVFLPKTYRDLQQSLSHDMPAACSKLLRAHGKSGFGQGSELWEMLAVQALERCEYVLAAEFLVEAVSKAPEKAKLLQLLAEVSALLKEKERARVFAEQAYEASPQSAELRNLLLQVAPEVWADRLRQLSSTANTRAAAAGEGDGDDADPDGTTADAYAPPSALSNGRVGPGTTGAAATAGQRGNPAPSSTSSSGATPGVKGAYLSAESAGEAEDGWLGRIKSKASGALKAIHSPAAPAGKKTVSPSKTAAPKPAAAVEGGVTEGATAGQAGEDPPAEHDAPTPAEEPLAEGAGRLPTVTVGTDADTSSRPKSRGSFISRLMPGADRARSPKADARGSLTAASVEGADQDKPAEPSRPQNRGSFISRILPDAGRALSPNAAGARAKMAAAQEGQVTDPAQTSPARPTSQHRGSFISRLLPDPDRARSPNSGSRASAESAQEGQAVESAERPTSRSRSSFVSRLLPGADKAKSPERGTGSGSGSGHGGFLSSLLPSAFLSTGASAEAKPEGAAAGSSPTNSSPGKRGSVGSVGSVGKASPAGAAGGKGSPPKPAPPAGSPVKPGAPQGKRGVSSTLAGASTKPQPGKSAAQPKARQPTKYNTDAHPSRLALERDEGRVNRPQRPVISRDERHMLDLILSGNQNVS
jgi:tetratricopeptide (TPR) repeat protein